jgi:hypothetical protein
MRNLLVLSVSLVVLSLGAIAAAGDLESGLKVGQRAGSFFIKDCTGPNAGKSLCYR